MNKMTETFISNEGVNDLDVINNEGILCDEVDVEHNMKELKIRCSKCRELMKE